MSGIVTIDGPAGAGKTTVSRELARRLGFTYVDTGALYRGVAVVAGRENIPPEDEEGLVKLCQGLTFRFVPVDGGPAQRLFANGEDLTDYLRTPKISMLASTISARPGVRACLLSVQRDLGDSGRAVFEGRDMGTVVFPGAPHKFFLTADLATRARRRFEELLAAGKEVAEEEVRHDMDQRDAQDSSRKVAPLAPAPDAVIVDSSGKGVDQVVAFMLEKIKEKE